MRSTDQKDERFLMGTIEALLFASEKSLKPRDIASFLNIEEKEVLNYIERLRQEYRGNKRGLDIIEIANGFKMATNILYGETLKNFFSYRNKTKLSQASLEILAIIAYRQPITKREIYLIRGKNCDLTIKSLLEKGLIKIAGRKKTAGRPFLYRTTEKFLEHFGLKSLKDLPPLKNKEVQDGLKEIA